MKKPPVLNDYIRWGRPQKGVVAPAHVAVKSAELRQVFTVGDRPCLTEAQRRHLEQRLQEERARLRRDVDRSLATQEQEDDQGRPGDLTKYPFHVADLGTDTMDAELGASNETRMSGELAEIDATLDRLYRTPERFGICEETGRPIPFERLDIVPWARTCNQAGT